MTKSFVRSLSYVFMMAIVTTACNNNAEQKKAENNTDSMKTGIKKADFGTADGKPVYLYTLTNAKGDEVKITNYGSTVTSWISPDKNGKRTSIVLGFDNLSGYLAKP